MSMDNNLNEKLLNKGENPPESTKRFSVNYFETLFINQNITEGNSLNLYLKEGGKEAFLRGLNTNERSGLYSANESDLKNRRDTWGTNERIQSEAKVFMDFVWESLEDPMLRVLILAAIVSLIIGILQEGLETGWIEGFSIFLAVFVVVSISSFQNYSKDQQFRKLEEENAKKNINVRRDGFEIKSIPIEDLLVGDILHLAIGDIVPGDGILIKGAVTMDESSMTGESDMMKKTTDPNLMDNKLNPFIISGTQVIDGTGIMVVCAIGRNCVAGKSQDLMESEVDETPLQKQLTEVADKIGDIGLLVAVFIGLVIILKEVIQRFLRGEAIFGPELLDVSINAFIISVTVIVVAIPEGLPMAVTISLAFSVFKMKEEHNLVRHLDASETMGNVNNICTDKTGTLTRGIMEVRQIFMEDEDLKQHDITPLSQSGLSLLSEAISNNVSAYIEKEDSKMVAKGNPTECALLNFLIGQNLDISRRSEDDLFGELPFSSEYKFMSRIYKLKSNQYRLYIKGAPEYILGFCNEVRVNGGRYVSISEKLESIKAQQEKYAEKCMRTIGVGYKDCTINELNRFKEEGLEFFKKVLEKSVKLIAIFGIADAPRDQVSSSIKLCHEAGVKVRMVTGDNIKTAIAISQDVGILSTEEANEALARLKLAEKEEDVVFAKAVSRYIALEGNEFRELTGGYTKQEDGVDDNGRQKFKYELNDKDKFKKVTASLKVIARASPDDKFLLVLGLKKLKNIVAVTGDGTNDAPALKKSDVGFAMGQRGTDIAKAASDIILLNDSFSSIVTAIKYGRNVYDCIRKFLQFQLTCNVVAVFMTLLGGVILEDSPLNPIQMLWVNLIMDSFASLALATEPPSDKLLYRKPYPKETSIITPMMKINIASQSLFQIIVLILVIFYGDLLFDVPSDRELNHYTWNEVNGYHFTIFFNIFVFLQVFNSINARKLLKSDWNIFENMFNNWMYLFVQGIIVGGQILMITFGGRALRTHPLSLKQHLTCILIASLSLVAGFFMKLLPVGFEEPEKGAPAFSIAKSMRGKSMDYSKVKSSKSIKI